VHAAVDTVGDLLALRVSPANEYDRDEMRKLSEEIQQATGENVELAYVDQGYIGERSPGYPPNAASGSKWSNMRRPSAAS